jgi:hypothetical protein
MPLPIPSPEELNAASAEELAAYAGPALERLPRGFLPPAVFMPLRERVRASTLDVVTFLSGTDGDRVLVGQRGAQPGDRWWSGMQNIAGSVILPTEELEPLEVRMADGRQVDLGGARISQDITTPADRILSKEFGGSVQRVAPVRELMRYWVDVGNISENKISSWTEVALAPDHDEVIGGAFYDTQDIIANPPENLVHGHAYFIELGLLALRAAQ